MIQVQILFPLNTSSKAKVSGNCERHDLTADLIEFQKFMLMTDKLEFSYELSKH